MVYVVFTWLIVVGSCVYGKDRRLLNQDLDCVCMNKQSRRINMKINLTDQSCKERGENIRPIDCKDVFEEGYRKNGVYRIFPKGNVNGYNVYCDMTTDGGGWTVFQRRFNGSVDFYRTWREYMNGFGDVHGEYWLGNEKIHQLTSEAKNTLRIDMMDQAGIWKYASYSGFSIGDNSTEYKLSAEKYNGTAGDALSIHIGQTFKTKDRQSSNKCATKFTGAWWYANCHYSNLNGLYDNTKYGKGLNWNQWRGIYHSMKATEMKIKRV